MILLPIGDIVADDGTNDLDFSGAPARPSFLMEQRLAFSDVVGSSEVTAFGTSRHLVRCSGMSGGSGRPEVIGKGQTDAFDPKRTISPAAPCTTVLSCFGPNLYGVLNEAKATAAMLEVRKDPANPWEQFLPRVERELLNDPENRAIRRIFDGYYSYERRQWKINIVNFNFTLDQEYLNGDEDSPSGPGDHTHGSSCTVG